MNTFAINVIAILLGVAICTLLIKFGLWCKHNHFKIKEDLKKWRENHIWRDLDPDDPNF